MPDLKRLMLVEDDPTDVRIFQRALKGLELKNNLDFIHANDGQEALELINNNSDKPDLILVDINMPRMSGKEFISKIKEDETLKKIPVLMLSTSEDQGDIQECFKKGAAGYFLKSMDFNEGTEVLRNIFNYWNSSYRAE